MVVVAIIPLIDAASNDDSNGGQFEISSKFDFCCENSAVGSRFDFAEQKVAPFLTETIDQKVVQSS